MQNWHEKYGWQFVQHQFRGNGTSVLRSSHIWPWQNERKTTERIYEVLPTASSKCEKGGSKRAYVSTNLNRKLRHDYDNTSLSLFYDLGYYLLNFNFNFRFDVLSSFNLISSDNVVKLLNYNCEAKWQLFTWNDICFNIAVSTVFLSGLSINSLSLWAKMYDNKKFISLNKCPLYWWSQEKCGCFKFSTRLSFFCYRR